MKKLIALCSLIGLIFQANAQDNLITNIAARNSFSLNGSWQYIADPYETGFYDYHYKELNESNTETYLNNDTPANKSDKKEYGYNSKYTLQVPGD